jgi:outer membrane lipoprotein SlyB
MRAILVMFAVIAAAGLSGCANTRTVPPSQYSAAIDAADNVGKVEKVDSARVAAIEQTAKAYGVNVYWFNYPALRNQARRVN